MRNRGYDPYEFLRIKPLEKMGDFELKKIVDIFDQKKDAPMDWEVITIMVNIFKNLKDPLPEDIQQKIYEIFREQMWLQGNKIPKKYWDDLVLKMKIIPETSIANDINAILGKLPIGIAENLKNCLAQMQVATSQDEFNSHYEQFEKIWIKKKIADEKLPLLPVSDQMLCLDDLKQFRAIRFRHLLTEKELHKANIKEVNVLALGAASYFPGPSAFVLAAWSYFGAAIGYGSKQAYSASPKAEIPIADRFKNFIKRNRTNIRNGMLGILAIGAVIGLAIALFPITTVVAAVSILFVAKAGYEVLKKGYNEYKRQKARNERMEKIEKIEDMDSADNPSVQPVEEKQRSVNATDHILTSLFVPEEIIQLADIKRAASASPSPPNPPDSGQPTHKSCEAIELDIIKNKHKDADTPLENNSHNPRP